MVRGATSCRRSSVMKAVMSWGISWFILGDPNIMPTVFRAIVALPIAGGDDVVVETLGIRVLPPTAYQGLRSPVKGRRHPANAARPGAALAAREA